MANRDHDKLTDKLLRIEAGCQIQTADVAALLRLLMDYHQLLSKNFPGLPDALQRFLNYRKANLQSQLEGIENTDPGYAACLQQVIDQQCVNFPFDYN